MAAKSKKRKPSKSSVAERGEQDSGALSNCLLRAGSGWQKVHQWFVVLPEFQRRRLSELGFGPFLSIAPFESDLYLLAAVVERYRPETRSFHFVTGEMAITAEDWTRLTGLRFKGEPVLGLKQQDYTRLSEALFGKRYEPVLGHINLMRLQWFVESFGYLEPVEGSVEADQQLRAFLIYMLGNTIFCNPTKGSIHAIYLQFVHDLGHVRSYSWGSASLAFLQASLRSRAVKAGGYMEGFYQAIQIWLYDHVDIGRPRLRDDVPLLFPRMRRWDECYWLPSDVRQIGDIFRQLDNLTPGMITWRPYSDGEHDEEEFVREAMPIFDHRLPLLLHEKLDWHLPERVLRQFGRDQLIPAPPPALEKKGARIVGNAAWDSEVMKRDSVKLWAAGGSPAEAHLAEVQDQPYDDWFARSSMTGPMEESKHGALKIIKREKRLRGENVAYQEMEALQEQNVDLKALAEAALKSQHDPMSTASQKWVAMHAHDAAVAARDVCFHELEAQVKALRKLAEDQESEIRALRAEREILRGSVERLEQEMQILHKQSARVERDHAVELATTRTALQCSREEVLGLRAILTSFGDRS